MSNLKTLTMAMVLVALGLPLTAQDLRQAAPLDTSGLKMAINGQAGQLAITAGQDALVEVRAGPGELYVILISLGPVREDLGLFQGAIALVGMTDDTGAGSSALFVPDFYVGQALRVRAVKVTLRGLVFSAESEVKVAPPAPQPNPDSNPADHG